VPLSENDDVLLVIDINYFCEAVGITTMIQVPGLASEESGVNNILIVQPEHVTIVNAFIFVALLTLICNLVPNDLSNVLDDNVLWLKVFESEQANSMDLTWPDLHFLRILKLASVLHCDWKVYLVYV
jgi:hypothetical protein